MRLRNKVAVVTGGANGIGRAIALRFAQEGAVTVVVDRDEPNARETLSLIEKKGGTGFFVPADVSDREQTDRMIETVIERTKRVDILVTAAAIMERISMLDCSKEDFARTMDTNIHGVMNCVQGVIPCMKDQGRGKIIIMSSLASVHGRAGYVAYAAAAGTLTGFTRNAAYRLGQFGICVNGIAPGVIDTDFPESLKDEPEYREFRIRNTPLRRIGRPEDVVGTALFLSTEDSDFVTGETIVVDGGLSIYVNGIGQ